MIQKRHVMGVLVGGMAAAVLDIIYAMILTTMAGHGAMAAMRGVASGLIGTAAFQPGISTAALGFFLHCMILIVAAAIYYALSLHLPVLRTHAIVCGLLFGVLVYLFMNFIVLPISAIPFKISYTPWKLAQGFVSHGILVGLPIALIIRWFFSQKK